MRNLLQYPITELEIRDVINQIPESDGIGDLTGVIKLGIKQYFNYPENMDRLVEQLRIK